MFHTPFIKKLLFFIYMFTFYAIFGKPGSGKGTMGRLLEREIENMIHLPISKLLKERNLGVNKTYISNELIHKIVWEEINKLDFGGGGESSMKSVVFDGYPTAEWHLDHFDMEMGFFIDISDDTTDDRILNRTDGCSDDGDENFEIRWNEFCKNTWPIIKKLDGMGKIIWVDGERDKEEIGRELLGRISKIMY